MIAVALLKRVFVLVLILSCFLPVHAEPETEDLNPDDESESRLSSLTITDQKLNPEFSPDTMEYSVTLAGDVTSIEINCEAANPYADVEGDGSLAVEYTTANIDHNITVTAENGDVRTYTIHLSFDLSPELFVELDGQRLGFVLKDLDQLQPPEGFTMDEARYENHDITVFNNDQFPFSLVYLENDAKKSDWYCFSQGKVNGVFRTLVINKNTYYYAGIAEKDQVQPGYHYGSVNIVGEKLNGWSVDNASGSLVMLYLYDSHGKAGYYIYDTEQQTMMLRQEYEARRTPTKRTLLVSPMMVAIAIVLVIAAVFLVMIVGANGKHSLKESLRVLVRRFKSGNLLNAKGAVKDSPDVALVRTKKAQIFAAEASPDPAKVSDQTQPMPYPTQPSPAATVSERPVPEPVYQTNPSPAATIAEKTQPMPEPVKAVQPITKVQPEPVPVQNKKARPKKSFFKKKTQPEKPKAEKKQPEPEPVVIPEPAKQEEPFTIPSYDVDPMTEIQDYIDHLFYHDE